MTAADMCTLFASNLRRFVDASGFTQAEIAKRAGVTERWLRKLLAGKQPPSLATIAGLCNTLNLEVHELFAPIRK